MMDIKLPFKPDLTDLKQVYLKILIVSLLTSTLIVGGTNGAFAQTGTPQSVGSYTVQSGDSLFAIAQQLGISQENLVEFNNITDANVLQVGQVLLIPTSDLDAESDTSTLENLDTGTHYANPGETLEQLVMRTQQDLEIVAALNNLDDTSRLFPGQPILVPFGSEPEESLRFGSVTKIHYSPTLLQGKTGRLRIESRRPLSLTVLWNDHPLTLRVPEAEEFDPFESTQFSQRNHLQVTLVPVPALIEPQSYPLTISYLTNSGVFVARTWSVTIEEGPYDSQEIILPPGKGGLLDPTIVENELKKLGDIWSQRTPTLYASTAPTRSLFLRPINNEHPTTSPYGTRRSYNGGPYASYHSGQDFGAPEGTPIVAPTVGIVALNEPLEVRGNSILLDHGQGIVTGYWHLIESKVVAGQVVAAGDVIGLVGTTGLSTGAHLHWELRVYGISVDPMQFLDESLIGGWSLASDSQ